MYKGNMNLEAFVGKETIKVPLELKGARTFKVVMLTFTPMLDNWSSKVEFGWKTKEGTYG
jgi:hypothetical protein